MLVKIDNSTAIEREAIVAVTIEHLGKSAFTICFYVNGGEAFNVGHFEDETKALEAFNRYLNLIEPQPCCPVVYGLKDFNKLYE